MTQYLKLQDFSQSLRFDLLDFCFCSFANILQSTVPTRRLKTSLSVLPPVALPFHISSVTILNHPISHLSLCSAVSPHAFDTRVLRTGKQIFVALWKKWPFHYSEWLLPPPADTQRLPHRAHWASDRQQFQERYHRMSFSSKHDAMACSILQTLLFSHLLLEDLGFLSGHLYRLWKGHRSDSKIHSSKQAALGTSRGQKLIAWQLYHPGAPPFTAPLGYRPCHGSLVIIYSSVPKTHHSYIHALLRWLCLVYSYCMLMGKRSRCVDMFHSSTAPLNCTG